MALSIGTTTLAGLIITLAIVASWPFVRDDEPFQGQPLTAHRLPQL